MDHATLLCTKPLRHVSTILSHLGVEISEQAPRFLLAGSRAAAGSPRPSPVRRVDPHRHRWTRDRGPTSYESIRMKLIRTLQSLIVDNLRAAICKANRYEPEFQRVFAESVARGAIMSALAWQVAIGTVHRGIECTESKTSPGDPRVP